MIFSLVILIALSAFLQSFLGDMYTITVTASGQFFPDTLISAMRTVGVAMILSTVGIWAIKLNFLAFFRVFGRQIRSYMISWWISLILVVACGFAQLGIIPYRCLFLNLSSVTVVCPSSSGSDYIYKAYEAAVAIDIVSDAISKTMRIRCAHIIH